MTHGNFIKRLWTGNNESLDSNSGSIDTQHTGIWWGMIRIQKRSQIGLIIFVNSHLIRIFGASEPKLSIFWSWIGVRFHGIFQNEGKNCARFHGIFKDWWQAPKNRMFEHTLLNWIYFEIIFYVDIADKVRMESISRTYMLDSTNSSIARLFVFY